MARHRQTTKADRALAVAVLLLGFVLLSGISSIDVGAGYDRVGPRSFPFLVAASLIILGAALGALTFRKRLGERAAKPSLNRTSATFVLLTLALYVALLQPAGFVVASSMQFYLIARAFGSRTAIRDVLVAIAFSIVLFFVFSNGLGLQLPPGILADLL
jgi:putative tricarboxylic transport membrane protein